MARDEWRDGGTARPGWTSALGGVVADEASRPQAEVDRLAAYADHARALLTSGRDGAAVVRSARDSGERIGGHALVDLDLVLHAPPDGERALAVRLPVCGPDVRSRARASAGHPEQRLRSRDR